jgi:hypothetical protein
MQLDVTVLPTFAWCSYNRHSQVQPSSVVQMNNNQQQQQVASSLLAAQWAVSH